MNLKKLVQNKLEAKHIYYVVMTIIYVYLISKCIYQYIWGNGIDGCKLELLLIIILSLIIFVVSFSELNIFNKKKTKRNVVKYTKRKCIIESSFLALLFTTFVYLLISYDVIHIDFSNIIPNQIILSVIGLAILLLLLFFLIIYLIQLNIYRKN